VIPQGFIAILAKLFYKTPTVITLHGGDAFAFTNKALQKLKQYALRKSDAWTTNTRTTSSAVGNGHLLPPPYVIPMGVDVDRFSSGNRHELRADLTSDTAVVLFVGRLVEKKGVNDLISAFSMLPAHVGEKTRLWIIGDGELRPELEALAQRLGVAEHTKFWGRIANHQLPDYYAAGDIFVGPSVVAESGDTEGQGVVFLEAFAARLCVLATRTGGIGEVIEEGTSGVLVEPSNPLSLSQAMASLLCDEALRARLAANAFAKVQEKYRWPTIALKFESVYRRISARH
jgi:glycosyltransferase involved in cell wall biosynthesis